MNYDNNTLSINYFINLLITIISGFQIERLNLKPVKIKKVGYTS